MKTRIIPRKNATWAEWRRAKRMEQYVNSPEFAREAERRAVMLFIYGPDPKRWPN
jgi:hypothetical protein